MLDNKMTPASGGTLTEAAVEQMMGRSRFHLQNTTGESKKQVRIADYLPHGEENAVPRAQLAEQLGFSSVRALQAAIADEVQETGALILASPRGGYFMAATRDELLKYRRSLRSRAKNTFRRLRAVNNALRNCEGQLDLDGIDNPDDEQEATP